MQTCMGKPPARADIRRALGKTVRSLRLKTGMAQERLALESGIDRGYMGALERGVHSPTIETIYKLLPYLNVSFVEFAGEVDRILRPIQRPISLRKGPGNRS